jgi:cytoskeletal protein RodZ
VLLTRLLEGPADGFKIHHSPSLVITLSPSESSSSDSESKESTKSTPSSSDLVSDSYEASVDTDDEEGRRTVAIAVAQVNIRREAVGGLSLTAMPNVPYERIS